MKHLKTFEELKPSTYFSAADKLISKGHKSRADKLYDYGKSRMTSKTPFIFTIWFDPNLHYRKSAADGWVATREEANHIFQICKEIGIRCNVNDLYKEGVDKDPKMKSFQAEFKPKFKKFINTAPEPDFNKEKIHPITAYIVQGHPYGTEGFGQIMVKVEISDFAPGTKHNPLPEPKKGFIQKVGDFFGKGPQRTH